ncbi:Crotonase superfamily [Syntrophomonas zehnderi OL-4]|uniref:Crotonase superfamily n=1 Tax=Syntrophomonas zehnderi OL-4 TaxID=690567 RepID=A0A0E4GCT6_9FIRM|nr:crotonase/enoyl-CoA hydratase family protein [Syntrophomonas zehnderi]CFX23509.1 Crotonase superfamily [Syntrophomonas zehnderi OL-4]
MSDGKITVETRGNILLMGFNRPEKRNAFTLDMYYDLARAYGELSRNKNLRCGLLYAVGDHFSSGLDLPQWSPVFESGKWMELEEGMIDPFGIDEDNRCKKPVVMACQGICYTIGFELLLAADVRIAANDLRLAQLEVKRAIFPTGGGTVRMFQEIGWGNAMRYILTGDEMSGAEAYRLGLVQELVEPGQQFDRALEMAERICRAAPLGVQAALASARRARVHGDKAALASLSEEIKPLMKSKDSQEGLKAFLERREPNFTGE